MWLRGWSAGLMLGALAAGGCSGSAESVAGDAGALVDASPVSIADADGLAAMDAAAPAPAPAPAPVNAGRPDARAEDAQVPDAATVPEDPNRKGRPDGVALCYSELSRAHPATHAFWNSFKSGDLEARPAAIEALTAATLEYPEEQQFALLLGLAQLWRVAEPLPLESLDLFGLLDAITVSESALEDAYRLCPTDHRITAWLAPIKIRSGRIQGNDEQVAEGFEVLQQGLDHYPGFVLFSKFLVYADLAADDPDFMQAVEAVRENASYCGSPGTGLAADPACNNHPYASHNVEGASFFMGDMFAKAGDTEAAREFYESAMHTGTWDTWDYQATLLERLSSLDARVSAYTTADTFDDPEAAWQSAIQCSVCHRD